MKDKCSIENCSTDHSTVGFYGQHYRVRTKTPEYRAWVSMKRRCLNKNHRDYKNYGGRGIKVADIWLNDYEAFLKSVGNRPSAEYSIDRINNDGDYEPGNVRWATKLQQQCNRRPKTGREGIPVGVHWANDRQRWIASLRHKYVGSSSNLDEAIKIRELALTKTR